MDVTPQINALRQFIEARDFAGYDPYDGLNSPVLRALSCDLKWPRIAATQFMKRCPLNPRSLLLAPQEHNPKGIGLFLHGYARLLFAKMRHARQQEGVSAQDTGGGESEHPTSNIQHGTSNKKGLDQKTAYLLYLLDTLKSEGYSGNCWGYNFPWQSRAAFVPRWTPTIVNTSFIGHALLDTWEWLAIEKARDLAMSIADFLLNDLNRKEEGDTFCFSYTPTDYNYVHNANLMGASVLARLGNMEGIIHHKRSQRTQREGTFAEECRETALNALRYSMDHQRSDGSWAYAETDFQAWIDSYHTAFNLQAIKCFLDLGVAEEYRSAFEKGVDFYVNHFFLPDGTPKYYHDRVYPIDIHCPAAALAFLSSLFPRHDDLCHRIAQWMVFNMFDEKRGFFFFRKSRWFTNKISYMRWGQAWAWHGLTAYATAFVDDSPQRTQG